MADSVDLVDENIEKAVQPVGVADENALVQEVVPEEERAGHRQRRGRDDVAAPSFEPVCHASRPESQQLPNGISIHGGLQVHSIQDFPGYHDSRDAAAQDEGREHRGCRNIGRGKKAVVSEMPEGL